MKLITFALLFSGFTSVFGAYSIIVQDNIPIKRNWVGVLNECANNGLIMATPDTYDKNEELKRFMTANSLAYAHISANDLIIEGSFNWMTTGKAVTNTEMWHAGEPNNAGDQDCVFVGHNVLQLAWYDWTCDIETAVICEPAADAVVALVKSRLPIIRQEYERRYGERPAIARSDAPANILI